MPREDAVRMSKAWMDLMRRGDLAAAWDISDAALAEPREHRHTPRHLQRIWNGEPIAGRRVLIRCYHGLGDTIQFIRYAPLVQAIAAETTLWIQPALLELAATMRPCPRLLPLHDGVPAIDFDVDVELMELPHVFRSTLETLPADVPYLHARRRPRPRGGPLAVGFTWCAGDWDPARSIPFAALEPLLDVGGITSVALQMNLEAAVAARFDRTPGTAPIRTLADVIAVLDLVVSVDTMSAHLAGALGVPTWLLLPVDADWRWMTERRDTPWYPRTTLYRQTRHGDWSAVVEEARSDLARAARRHNAITEELDACRPAAHPSRPR